MGVHAPHLPCLSVPSRQPPSPALIIVSIAFAGFFLFLKLLLYLFCRFLCFPVIYANFLRLTIIKYVIHNVIINGALVLFACLHDGVTMSFLYPYCSSLLIHILTVYKTQFSFSVTNYILLHLAPPLILKQFLS